MRNHVKFLFRIVSMALLMLGISSFQSGTSSQTATEQNTPIPNERNSFLEADAEPRPQGRWSLVSGPDLRLLRDHSLPVVMSGVRNIIGRGPRWGGFLKITGATINNRSEKAVSRARIAWFISHVQNRTLVNRDSILLEGETPLFDVSIPAHTRIDNIEIPIIHFMRIARPLMRDGTFNGDFAIMFRVSEVQFDDGSVWREEQTAARLKPLNPNATHPQTSGESCLEMRRIRSDPPFVECFNLKLRAGLSPEIPPDRQTQFRFQPHSREARS